MSISIRGLAQRVIESRERATSERRLLLGITGPPAAGKSTLALKLQEAVNEEVGRCVAHLAPMDGFHLPSAELRRRDLLAQKGSPATFDTRGYLHALSLLRRVPKIEVRLPSYDRIRHEPAPGTITVGVSCEIVITEGNYLLLPSAPWGSVSGLLDSVWYLDASRQVILERLMRRHVIGGRSAREALDKVYRSDLANVAVVEGARDHADITLLPVGEDSYVTVNLRG